MLIYISECIAIALLTLTIWLLLLPSSDISLLIRVGALQTVYIFVDLMLPHSWMIVKLSIEFYVIFPEYLDIYYYIPFLPTLLLMRSLSFLLLSFLFVYIFLSFSLVALIFFSLLCYVCTYLYLSWGPDSSICRFMSFIKMNS